LLIKANQYTYHPSLHLWQANETLVLAFAPTTSQASTASSFTLCEGVKASLLNESTRHWLFGGIFFWTCQTSDGNLPAAALTHHDTFTIWKELSHSASYQFLSHYSANMRTASSANSHIPYGQF
jgi:hypothetical protein